MCDVKLVTRTNSMDPAWIPYISNGKHTEVFKKSNKMIWILHGSRMDPALKVTEALYETTRLVSSSCSDPSGSRNGSCLKTWKPYTEC